MILYKYCRPERIDVLESGVIMLTRARAFNDPFELNPHITSISDPIAYAKHIADRIKNFVILSRGQPREPLDVGALRGEPQRFSNRLRCRPGNLGELLSPS